MQTLADIAVVTLEHWPVLLGALAAILIVVALYRFIATHMGPQDFSGNGIVIGRAKVFDNRSLTLILEQLNDSLRTFTVLNQNFTRNLDSFQQQQSTDSAYSVKGEFAPTSGKSASEGAKHSADTAKDEKTPTDAPTSKRAGTPETGKAQPAPDLRFGPAAGDTLTDQVNLAYQILNLRILNERSLSDRLYQNNPRLQVVLGFQISIDPPKGMKNCVAVAEVELTLDNATEPISIVAMIPQEKTYNAATLSANSGSLDGSIISSVLKTGATVSRRENNLYLHRDADTIAFERNPGWKAGAFGLSRTVSASSATVFGWEFRPVLGRGSVSPGARQMLAVAALPLGDTGNQPAELKVRTRTYWRRYHRKQQTTSVRLSWWPLVSSGPREIENKGYMVPVLPTSPVQEHLEPKLTKLDWTDVGGGAAVVLVEGENFFTGTAVTIGGITYRAGEGNLVLKSDRALELHTTIDALAKGDAVLSGRFGRSKPLAVPDSMRPAKGINLRTVLAKSVPGDQYSRVSLTIVAFDNNGNNKALTLPDVERLPRPIIYLNGILVPGPYDYYEARIGEQPQAGQADNRPTALRVDAWVPAVKLSGNIMFKVPFCGEDWAAGAVLSVDAPSVARLGGAPKETLIISGKMPFEGAWIATLDKEYALDASPQFRRLTRYQLALTLSTALLGNYEKLQLRLGTETGYLLDIPSAKSEPAKPAIDEQGPPLTVSQGKSSLLDLQGTMLADITSVRLLGADLRFQAYSQGTRLRIFLTRAATANEGRFQVELGTREGASLSIPLYVVDPGPEQAEKS
jgi:hypothetical protein